MHIVYVCREYSPSLRGGGIASYIKEVAKGMAAAGHKVTVVCASDDTRTSSDYKDGEVDVVRLAGGDFVVPQVEKATPMKKLRAITRFFSYRRAVRDAILSLKDVDIIEVPEYGAEGYFLQDIGIPGVTRLHTPYLFDHDTMGKVKLSANRMLYYWQGLQELKLMKRSRYLTSCSTSLKEWTIKNTGNIPEDIKVIYNPIDVENTPHSIPTSSRLQNDVKTILFAGTVCDWKGCGDLAEVGALLQKQHDEMKFEIRFVGKTGAFAEDLKKKYGGYEWFDLVGKVPREELMDMYGKADVVCFPSWWENMPMVCIEALLQGAIVIGSNSGGMSEIIEDGRSGYLLAPQNPQMWADKIVEVLNMDDDARVQMSRDAQQRIESTFDIKVVVKQMTDFFSSVINDYKKHK